MKKSRMILLTSLLLCSSTAMAMQNMVLSKNNITFAPVHWACSKDQGSVAITNNTDKEFYIQIAVSNGSVGLATPDQKCLNVELTANSGHNSTICELAPNQTMTIDNDYAYGMNAKGTYQIETASN